MSKTDRQAKIEQLKAEMKEVREATQEAACELDIHEAAKRVMEVQEKYKKLKEEEGL